MRAGLFEVMLVTRQYHMPQGDGAGARRQGDALEHPVEQSAVEFQDVTRTAAMSTGDQAQQAASQAQQTPWAGP